MTAEPTAADEVASPLTRPGQYELDLSRQTEPLGPVGMLRMSVLRFGNGTVIVTEVLFGPAIFNEIAIRIRIWPASSLS